MKRIPGVVISIGCVLAVASPAPAGEHEGVGILAPGGRSVSPDTPAGPDAPIVLPEPPAVPPGSVGPVRPEAAIGVVHAVRTEHAPIIDGRLDDPAWKAAPVFDAFILNQPTEGGRGSERTELRVLFDDEKLYVAMTCFDSQPGAIVRSLGRRDTEPPTADFVTVAVAAGNDGRTAHRFYLNAGGLQADTLIYDDTQWLQSWDGVWEGAAEPSPEGWTAEIAIPLHLLGVDAHEASWGFVARRGIARTHELVSSVLVPRAANGYVSYFGRVDGVEGVGPAHAVEIVPYLATRSIFRPQFADPSRPSPRLWLGSADVGGDVTIFPGHGLLVNASLNPDFGEVQPDGLLLNVTSYETYYPEMRKFFTQGMDLFQTVGGMDQLQSMFYSRRIGLDVPILGAVKVTGRPTAGVAFGLVDALVDGPWQAGADANRPDGSVAFHPSRPFHLGPAEELPTSEIVPENFVSATGRMTISGRSWVGTRFSAATPLGGACTAADLARTPLPGRCVTFGVNAFGVDTSLKTDNGDWGIFGQAALAQDVLGAPRREPDGTLVIPGDTGAGGFVRAGKLGGEGFRLQLGYDYASPAFDLNAVGFQLDENLHDSHLDVGVSYPNGVGPFLSLDAWLHGELAFSADSRGLVRSGYAGFEVNLLLPGFHHLSILGGWTPSWYDIRELGGSGVAMNGAPTEGIRAIFDGDPNQPLALHALAALGHHEGIGPTSPRYGFTFEAGAVWHPVSALQTQLLATLDRTPWEPRYLQTVDASHFLLGKLDADTLTVTLRQDWGLTPRLTLQAYLQLFTAVGSYGPFYEGTGTHDQPLRQEALMPVAIPMPDPSFHTAELVANIVGRWEYRPGSTLFLVYSRTQDEIPPLTPDRTLGASRLFSGAATDLVLVKWAQFLSL